MTILSVTRAVLAAATTISAAIIRVSATITDIATKFHAAALNLAINVADRKIDKAYNVVQIVEDQIAVLAKLRTAALQVATDKQAALGTLITAAKAELDLLAAA